MFFDSNMAVNVSVIRVIVHLKVTEMMIAMSSLPSLTAHDSETYDDDDAFSNVPVNVPLGFSRPEQLVEHEPIIKGSFYIAQYPVRWPAQSALHVLSPPWQTCPFRHQLVFSGKHFQLYECYHALADCVQENLIVN